MRWFHLAVIIVFALATLIFAVQNLQTVTITFLGFSMSLPLALQAIIIYLLGMATGGSIWSLLRNSMSYHEGWQKQWRSPEPKREYDVVVVSFDARENDKADLAKNKKASYVERLEKAGGAEGMHFLTGTQDSIDKIANARGTVVGIVIVAIDAVLWPVVRQEFEQQRLSFRIAQQQLLCIDAPVFIALIEQKGAQQRIYAQFILRLVAQEAFKKAIIKLKAAKIEDQIAIMRGVVNAKRRMAPNGVGRCARLNRKEIHSKSMAGQRPQSSRRRRTKIEQSLLQILQFLRRV